MIPLLSSRVGRMGKEVYSGRVATVFVGGYIILLFYLGGRSLYVEGKKVFCMEWSLFLLFMKVNIDRREMSSSACPLC